MAETKDEAALIRHMLEHIQRDFDRHGKTNEFIESIQEQFDKKGRLTPKQLEALRKFYDRC